jgi:cytochrome o ubiquinol oxidase operon protein cyoD
MERQPPKNYELGNAKSYFRGFLLSLLLTLTSYYIVTKTHIHGIPFLLILTTLAFLQAIVQFIFSLQVHLEKHPRWNLTALVFLLGTLLIVVIGSIWIMYSLNYRLM